MFTANVAMFLDPGVFFPQVNLVDSSQEKTHYSMIVNSLVGTRRMQEERKGESLQEAVLVAPGVLLPWLPLKDSSARLLQEDTTELSYPPGIFTQKQQKHVASLG